MASFRDSNGKDWLVRIDVAAIRRVRSKYSIDLAKILGDREAFENLQDDICLLVDVIHELCIEQCTASHITPEQFAASLAGDAIEAAIEAFLEAALEFLPKSKRLLMEQLIEGQKKAQRQAEEIVQTAINQGLIDNAVTDAMTQLRAMLTEKPNESSTTGNPS